jgi:Flp pilus assembly protein TadG
LVILAFGAIETGRMLWQHEIITKGVRDGARYLTRVPVSCTAPGPGGTFAAVDEQTAINLVTTGTTSSSNPILTAYGSATFTVEVDCRDTAALGLSGGTYTPVVRMIAEVPYLDYFIGVLGIDDVTFAVIHEEAHVGE